MWAEDWSALYMLGQEGDEPSEACAEARIRRVDARGIEAAENDRPAHLAAVGS